MKAGVFRLVAATIAVSAVAAAFLLNRYAQPSEREAYIFRCNEEGAGGMFTSREYCEELYERSRKR
jgi:hypothetical protein